ncbi:hypothetical protein DSUL_140014 [Desulfovibrionales bacterium]
MLVVLVVDIASPGSFCYIFLAGRLRPLKEGVRVWPRKRFC